MHSSMKLRAECMDKEWRRQVKEEEARQAEFEAIDDEEYMRLLGYSVHGDSAGGPELAVSVVGHDEEARCTMYHLQCTLGAPFYEEEVASWQCKKRLCDIREELLVRVKKGLGEAYPAHFSETPFARHGGLPGTTARLREWFRTLSTCINSGALPLREHALVLRFLQTPLDRDRGGATAVARSLGQPAPAAWTGAPMEVQMIEPPEEAEPLPVVERGPPSFSGAS